MYYNVTKITFILRLPNPFLLAAQIQPQQLLAQVKWFHLRYVRHIKFNQTNLPWSRFVLSFHTFYRQLILVWYSLMCNRVYITLCLLELSQH